MSLSIDTTPLSLVKEEQIQKDNNFISSYSHSPIKSPLPLLILINPTLSPHHPVSIPSSL